ncbi:MAG: histidine kinase [Bacteroidia bacterium]|nr:histidine kinase [Bacteroidia bacterium]
MIKQKGWSWILILGAFYLGLGLLTIEVVLTVTDTRTRYDGVELDAEFEGNDWVTWEDTDKGVVAARVHPLPGYKPTDKGSVKEGDRIVKLDYAKVVKAEAVEKITSSSPPSEVIVVDLQREDPISFYLEEVSGLIQNGFRLTFSFNEVVAYWHIIGWLVGIGSFVAFVMLAILVPVIRSQKGPAVPLLGVVISALLFFLLQLVRHLYLIIESNLKFTGFEKAFILSYTFLLVSYSLFYFIFRSDLKKWFFFLPSLLVGGFLLYEIVDILYLSKDLKYFHLMIEKAAACYFMLHLAGAILLYLADSSQQRNKRSYWWILATGCIAAVVLLLYALPNKMLPFSVEHLFFVQILLLFFPLINATYLQLQFGKVSLVVTQTIQYLVAIVVSVVLYLVVVQLFDYLNTSIRYRRILEFITFIFGVIGLRLLYESNEGKLRKYFVTSQQEKASVFRNFIAQIPQYTSARLLRKDILFQVRQYFQTELVDFWWGGDVEDKTYGHDLQMAQVYESLQSNNSNWGKTKEIASLRLEDELEVFLLDQQYHLIFRVSVDEYNHGLLLLGRKKRGVYNLADIELMSQLIQQTQLTLNVLQLVTREKELIQQTYEANLTALRSQINPHFLFNTLNSIGELVHESAEMAEAAVEKLAFIFRYTLNKSSQNFVPLSEEMKLITTYLELEKIRFGDRLETQILIHPEVKDIPIPAFILQTLVENCIKHGIAKILHNGFVSIEARREGDTLVCDVFDNGPGIDLTRIYRSTGLSNSISRMENLYDQKNLLYFENTGDGTLVRMKVPIKDASFMMSEE